MLCYYAVCLYIHRDYIYAVLHSLVTYQHCQSILTMYCLVVMLCDVLTLKFSLCDELQLRPTV
jgi:hypothetical protein